MSDTELRQGWQRRVRAKELVSLIVYFTFLQPDTKDGTIDARVVKPDGSTYGKPFKKEVSGKAGDPEVHIFLSAQGA